MIFGSPRKISSECGRFRKQKLKCELKQSIKLLYIFLSHRSPSHLCPLTYMPPSIYFIA